MQAQQTVAPLFYRHQLPVRLIHWINVICLCILLMSGLNIFNVHPHLYLGKDPHFATPLFSITTKQVSKNEYRGVTRVFGYEFDTNGVWGLARGADHSSLTARGFPHLATIPSTQWLTMARHWHFFFAPFYEIKFLQLPQKIGG